VHHGNGTEDGFLHNSSLFYGSTHELGNFPGTGRQPSLETVKPLEMETLRQLVGNDILFDELFDLANDSLWGDIQQRPPYQVSRNHPSALTQRIVDRQIPSGKRSRYDFRIKWREILYEMLWFGPSLVIISAGFDAHDDDPLADLELTEEDYYWATEACLLACRCCSSIKSNSGKGEQAESSNSAGRNPGEVKCLSILEGGYHLEAISKSSISHVDALFKSPYGYSLDDYPGQGEDEQEVAELAVAKEPPAAAREGAEAPAAPEFPATAEEETEATTEEGDAAVQSPLSIEDILKGLDSSISSLLMEALMSIPDPNGEGEEEEEQGDNEEEEQGAKEES
jgi:hypothetical protein